MGAVPWGCSQALQVSCNLCFGKQAFADDVLISEKTHCVKASPEKATDQVERVTLLHLALLSPGRQRSFAWVGLASWGLGHCGYVQRKDGAHQGEGKRKLISADY